MIAIGGMIGIVAGCLTCILGLVTRQRSIHRDLVRGIDPSLLVTAPFYQTLHFGLARFRVPAPYDELKFRSTTSVDRAARRVLTRAKTPPDIYMALSQTGTLSGVTAWSSLQTRVRDAPGGRVSSRVWAFSAATRKVNLWRSAAPGKTWVVRTASQITPP